LGLASFDGTFQLLKNGERLLRSNGNFRREVATLIRDYQEDDCFPFRLLAEAIRCQPQGSTFEFLYHDVCRRCRTSADLVDAISNPSNRSDEIPDTPKRRLKLMLRIMERTGAVQSCNDSALWVQWDSDATEIIVGSRGKMDQVISVDSNLPLCATLNEIVEGVPGTGKSHLITTLRGQFTGVRVVVMHPAMSYEDLVEGVRPTAAQGLNEGLLLPKPVGTSYYDSYSIGGGATKEVTGTSGFGVRGGLFLLACAEACRNPRGRYLIVLDELNRCNVPRALGELLLCLEESKRWRWIETEGRWDGSVSVRLPYSGLPFFVPNNLYVLGTLNSSDRSITALDQAIRRRFTFHRLEPLAEFALLDRLGTAAKPLSESVRIWVQINRILLDECGPDSVLGHSYFFDAARLAEGPLGITGAVRWLWRSALLPQVLDALSTAGRLDVLEGALQAAWSDYLAANGLRIRVLGAGAGRAARLEEIGE
jgi:hypothetical protein